MARKGLTKETLGIPVIGLGVPTVLDAFTIAYDVCQDVEKIPGNLAGMFVTPKNIDDDPYLSKIFEDEEFCKKLASYYTQTIQFARFFYYKIKEILRTKASI